MKLKEIDFISLRELNDKSSGRDNFITVEYQSEQWESQ